LGLVDFLGKNDIIIKNTSGEKMKQEDNYYELYISGDDSAFEQILSKYRTGLILYSNRFVKNIDIAEDIADEVFFRLSIKKIPVSSNLKAYLYKMVHNLSIDHLRKIKRISEKPIEEHLEIYYEHIEQDIIKKEQLHNLMSKINELPSDYAQVLYLAYLEGFNNSAIAKIMKKSNRQIENLLYRAKKQLKGKLTDEEQ